MTMPFYAITIGDPAGIGPEILLKAMRHFSPDEQARWKIYVDPWLLNHWATRLSLPLSACTIEPLGFAKSALTDEGTCAQIAWESLKAASGDLKTGAAKAVVTLPISKTRMHAIGFSHPGHTEFFANESKSETVRMMFVGKNLKIVLETIHLPLEKVAASLSSEHFRATLRLTQASLKKYFAIDSPKLAVCGLNPHAGENGYLGKEEIKILKPVIEETAGVRGPFASDAYFGSQSYARYDATVCLYHDQGLIPFKMLHFHDGVNLTLGLPTIRTSPDHGPAFDIAGRGIANEKSLLEAMQLAKRLS